MAARLLRLCGECQVLEISRPFVSCFSFSAFLAVFPLSVRGPVPLLSGWMPMPIMFTGSLRVSHALSGTSFCFSLVSIIRHGLHAVYNAFWHTTVQLDNATPTPCSFWLIWLYSSLSIWLIPLVHFRLVFSVLHGRYSLHFSSLIVTRYLHQGERRLCKAVGFLFDVQSV